MVARGCGGSRVAGGIYAIGATSPNGVPFRDLLICPPHRITREELRTAGISARGVHLLKRPAGSGSGYDLVDVIGREHYPTPAHWIVESERLGISRRLPSTLDFSKVTGDTRLMAIHFNGWIEDQHQRLSFWQDRQEYLLRRGRQPYCPRSRSEHTTSVWLDDVKVWSPMCCGLYWEDQEGESFNDYLQALPDYDAEALSHIGDRAVWVKAAGGDFSGLFRPGEPPTEEDQEPLPIIYEPAIFGSWPIGRIEVVEDREQDSHVKAMEAATCSSLPVELVEE